MDGLVASSQRPRRPDAASRVGSTSDPPSRRSQLKDLEFHGYNTGIKGVQEQAERRPSSRTSTWCFSTRRRSPPFEAGAVNSATETTVKIWTKPRRRRAHKGGMKSPRFAGVPWPRPVHAVLPGPGRVHRLLLVRVQAFLPDGPDDSRPTKTDIRTVRGSALRHVPARPSRPPCRSRSSGRSCAW